VGGGDKNVPPSKFFAKHLNKNAIKHQKGVTSPKNFYNPYMPSLSKFDKNTWTLPLDLQTVCTYEHHTKMG
jgi:hypothetical protein